MRRPGVLLNPRPVDCKSSSLITTTLPRLRYRATNYKHTPTLSTLAVSPLSIVYFYILTSASYQMVEKCSIKLLAYFLIHTLACFYPRDVVSALLATATWLAGWMSVTSRYCIKTAKPILQLFRPSDSPVILVSYNSLRRYPIPRETPSAAALNTRGWEKWLFSTTEIAVYLGNGARQADSYYGTLIGSHRCRIQWYHFRWRWVTPNPGFKVTVYLQVEYLKNVAF